MVLLVEGYDELRLRIDRQTDGSHRLFVSTGSGEASAGFELPFSELELENFIFRVSRPGRRLRRIPSSALEDAKEFGARLFRAAFHDQVRDLYRDALADARSRGYGLRITLCLSGSPDLVDVPWEFLFDDPDFLAVSALTPVVRYLDLPRGQRPLSVAPPLRILAVVSSPADAEQLDVELERENLEQALRGLTEAGAVELHWLERSTLTALLAALRSQEFHGLHYIGHGAYDHNAGQGTLLFEDHDGWARSVSGDQLGAVLHDFSSLRLAVLNACEGARAGLSDPFSGVAGSLVQRDIPAVVAMQFEISDQAAIAFAQSFYEALATGSPVDASLAAARLSMLAARSDDIEWGTPVLFMRVPDGRIFDLPPDPVHSAASADQPDTDHAHIRASAVSANAGRGSSQTELESTKGIARQARNGSEPAPDRDEAADAQGGSPSRATRHRARWLLIGLGTVLAVAILGVILAPGSSPPAKPSAAQHPATTRNRPYTAEVNRLCRLVKLQLNALPTSVSSLKAQMAAASTWQQRQQLISQEVDSRINDADNDLINLDSLQPPTARTQHSVTQATRGLNANLRLLNTYQVRLQNVHSEGQLARRVAIFDRVRPTYLHHTVNVASALLVIGGATCDEATPNLPFVPVPQAPTKHPHSAPAKAAAPLTPGTQVPSGNPPSGARTRPPNAALPAPGPNPHAAPKKEGGRLTASGSHAPASAPGSSDTGSSNGSVPPGQSSVTTGSSTVSSTISSSSDNSGGGG